MEISFTFNEKEAELIRRSLLAAIDLAEDYFTFTPAYRDSFTENDEMLNREQMEEDARVLVARIGQVLDKDTAYKYWPIATKVYQVLVNDDPYGWDDDELPAIPTYVVFREEDALRILNRIRRRGIAAGLEEIAPGTIENADLGNYEEYFD